MVEIQTKTETGRETETKAPEKAERRRHGSLVMRPFEEMERLFEDRGWLHPSRWDLPSWAEMKPLMKQRVPSLDVIDRDKEVVVRAAVPGVDKEGLDISIGDGTVTIKGSTKHEETEKKANYYRHEISTGEFSRTVMLPSNLDAEKAKASLKKGVLEIRIPKREGAESRPVSVEEE